MPNRTEAIQRFLMASTKPDLAVLYNPNMECQVNVAQDGGERIESEFQGKRWQGWTDGFSTWKPFRIPYNAGSEPTYEDKEIKYDLAEHVEAIGMTGWDWKNRCSRWVAFDFDGIVGHSDKHSRKLDNEQLEAIKKALNNIDWVTIRKSTSGTGLHIYVFLDNVPTANHHEHAALARAILGMLSAISGFDFHSKVDICVPSDTWVQTKYGPRRVKDLMNQPLDIVLNGNIQHSETGFFHTGYKTVYEIKTKKGYKVRATAEHPFLCGCSSFKSSKSYPTLLGFHDLQTWKQLKDIKSGDKIYLNKHVNLTWNGEGSWNDGYLLGWLIGDGRFSSREKYNNYQNSIDFWPTDYHLIPFVTRILPNCRVYKMGDVVSLRSPYLEELRLKYVGELTKKIPAEIEEASSDFYCGFISALFDTDGDVSNNRTLHFSQSNLQIVEAVQRMLLRLGIVSSINKSRDAGEMVILGRRVQCKTKYLLSIGRENIIIFNRRVGFQHNEKKSKIYAQLHKLFNNKRNKTHLATEHFTDEVISISEVERTNVFDIQVMGEHAFDANGFVAHNCGGNMWVWHRKMRGTEGLTLIKKGGILQEVPPNWKDHVKVVSGSRRKNLPQDILGTSKEDSFEELFGQRQRVPLDDEHKKLIEYLRTENAFWWWDQDHHMLVTHTWYIQKAHNELGLRGFFATNSPGTNLNEQNCFMYPLRRGAWTVRRFSLGVQEHPSWDQDGAGWTRTYLNREPDLATAAKAYGGIEDRHGNFVFQETEVAAKAAQLLGVNINPSLGMAGRETKLSQHKDGRLIVSVERKEMDVADKMPGYLANKKEWTRIYNTQVGAPTEPEAGNYDDLVRHLVTETQEDYGWMIKSEGEWRYEPLAHVRIALGSMGLNQKDITSILGSSVFRCWKVVNKPFQPEYPGDREWNRNAAQFKFAPSNSTENLSYPTWHKILEHCGGGLNEAIKQNGWCRANGIKSGGDYLKCWVASLFQEPLEPLPYLFFYGPQNSGKSIFHEALSLLVTKGYVRADAALVSQSMFNGELEGAIICVVEETDLRKDRIAYNRIKDWVTSKHLLIHHKGRTPFHIPNSAHFIHTANDYQACPIFTGDTRITMSYVGPIEPLDMIPKKQLLPLLEKEAADFLAEIMNLEIPPSNDRLNVPVIATEDKNLAQELNQTEFERFLAEKCSYASGSWIKFSELFDKFIEAVDPNEMHKWSKIRVGRSLPPNYPKGRSRKDGQWYVGNVCWAGVAQPETPPARLILQDGYLVPSEG